MRGAQKSSPKCVLAVAKNARHKRSMHRRKCLHPEGASSSNLVAMTELASDRAIEAAAAADAMTECGQQASIDTPKRYISSL